MNPETLAMFGLPAGGELVIIGIFGLLIFGRRLPDVARSIGKSIVEFKKGIREVKDDIDVQSKLESQSPARISQTPAPPPAPTSEPANTAPAVDEPARENNESGVPQ